MAKSEKVSDVTKELGAAGSLGQNPTVGEQQSMKEQQGGEGGLGMEAAVQYCRAVAVGASCWWAVESWIR